MTENSAKRIILGPFSRVEGDLEVQVEIEENTIKTAWVNSPLFRGYEQILLGKKPLDALVYTPRICGICSVAQSVATAKALANAQGLQICPNGQLLTNLILATENIADHLSHFYLFFMPDFARDNYADKKWFETTQQRFKAQTGTIYKDVLPARAAFLHMTAILAGKWPHSLAIQPGGVTRVVESHELHRLTMILKAFRFFLQEKLFGVPLETISQLKDQQGLFALSQYYPDADFSRFLKISQDLQLSSIGRAYDQFMSYGAYENNGEFLFKQGVFRQQSFEPLNPETIREDISHSWLSGKKEALHPFQGETITDNTGEDGYSWCKAPRLDAQVMEVGAIARQIVDGHPLISDLVTKHGANVQNRVVARLLEIAILVPKMEKWLQQIKPDETFCYESLTVNDAEGVGLIEAARGSLGHWLKIENGQIANYQIIAPTTWNFSPRDSKQQAGALEFALKGTRVNDLQQQDINIQHIIRSFDPCMVCTVH